MPPLSLKRLASSLAVSAVAAELVEEAGQFKRRNAPIIGAAGFGCDPQRFLGGAQLCRAELLAGDLRARGQRSERQNVFDDPAFDLDFHLTGNTLQRKGGTGREARFHHGRLGDTELVIGGLQAAII